jgi:hypothetical protein
METAGMKRSGWMLSGLLVGAMAILTLADAAAAQPLRRPGMRPVRRPRRPRFVPLVGKPAPDFDLPVLVEQADPKGKRVNRITEEKVQLSSFRGKRIVCVFFSSYT